MGQPNAALQALHDVITSKRHRTWQKVLETIMFKYVELCIQLKKGRLAKDGLIQYRIVCQQVNVNSLEEVIKHFLKLATEKAEQAQAQAAASAKASTLEIDDLEAENTPENLMLKSVSVENDKDRADRELVTPWFKFLWETYRSILEILRNNNKLEALYAMTAHRAFQFCVTYKRTTEFRRLCEILRNHLANLMKYRDQRDRPDMTLPETQNFYLETRFEQLKAAADLELWQEAFRTIEDIHGLTIILNKSPNPRMMASYFSKLTKVFWVSENYLYHAYAWYKLFNLSKTYNRNLTAEDLKAMASAVLLSAVAIPPYESRTSASVSNLELEFAKERDVRMATLLGYNLDPKRDPREVLSRKALLKELVSKGILSLVSIEARQCYALFEKEFHPLDLCKHAQKVFSSFNLEAVVLSASSPIPTIAFDQFLPRMRSLAVVRMLQQSSQVYQTMKLETLQQMVPFLEFSQVERILVDATKGGAVAVRLDHQNKCVRFEGDELESDSIKNHLVLMAQKLRKGIKMMYPDATPAAASLASKSNTADLLSKIEVEHKLALARKVIIERRKEEQERVLQEHEKELEEARVALQRKNEAAEAKRLEEERRSREEKRILQEMEEKEKQEALALIAEAEKRNKALGKGKKGLKIKLEEGQKIDKRSLMEDAIKEQIKERQDMERKLNRLAKKMDHLERAKREEEVPLIEAAYKVKMAEDEQHHKEMQQQNAEKHRQSWEVNVEEKKRLSKMASEKDSFAAAIVTRRSEEFEALRIEREERINELRSLRRAERELARRRAYVRKLQQIEEEARAEAEAAERERKEEEARARREEERRASEENDRRGDGESEQRRDTGRYEPRRYEPSRGGDSRYGGDSRDSRYGDSRYGDSRYGERDRGGGSRFEPSRGSDSRYDSRDSRDRGSDSRYERRDDRGSSRDDSRGGSRGGGSRW